MTKKHFNALAEAIRGIARAEERKLAAERVAEVCRRFNGRLGDCPADELNAIVSDHLRGKLPAGHPCKFN